MIRPEENEVIEAEAALFAVTEAMVIAMQGRDMSREAAWRHLEQLLGQTEAGPQEKEIAKAQFDLIWPEEQS